MISRITQSAVVAAFVISGVGAAQAETLYAGGSIGSPDYKNSINGVEGTGSGVGAKLFSGYQVTPNFAIEGSAFDLGHIDDATGKVNLRGLSVDAVGSYELAPNVSVLGRAGLAEGRFTSSNGDDWSPALKVGAGLQYDLTKQVALRGEYEYYRFTDAFDGKPKVGEFSVGVKFGF